MLLRKDKIYADAAAATPISEDSKRELLRLLNIYENPGSLHGGGVAAKKELETARKTIADVIGAHPDEIIFTASGTEANNLALQGVLRALMRRHGAVHAVTSTVEHQSVLEPLLAFGRDGLHATMVAVDREGLIDISEFAKAITDTTVFVSIQLVNSEVGTIQPVRECTKIIRRIRKERMQGSDRGALPLYFHTDASQAPLWLPLAVEKLGVDLMTLDAQKVLGPKGVGILFVKRGVEIGSVIRGGAQERGLRGGTENVPLAGAFSVALLEAQTGAEPTSKRVALIRDFCLQEIMRRIPGVIVNGPSIETNHSARVANNINISVPGLDGQMAVIALDAEGIATSTRSACTTGDEEPSHVILALGVERELAKTAVRITLLPSVTAHDAKRIARTLAKIAQRYRTVV